MLLCQFLRVIAEKIGAHIGFSSVIMGDRRQELRFQNGTLHRSVRLGGLLQLQVQDSIYQLIRPVLRAQKIAQRIGNECLPSVCCTQPLSILQHMRVGAHNHIGTPVCKLLCQCALTVHNGVAVLYAPVHTHDHKVGLPVCCTNLLLDHIRLAGVDHVGGHGAAGGDAIGVLRVGKVGDGHPVDGLQRNAAVVIRTTPQAGGDYVLRHALPETQGGSQTGCALIVGVVI